MKSNMIGHLKEFAHDIGQRIDQFHSERSATSVYLIALALVGLAFLMRLAIAPITAGVQYVTFFPAIALAAIVGGFRAGLFATLIGLLLATYSPGVS